MKGYHSRSLYPRVAELNVILDRARFEDIAVANENRSLTDVAHEMLVKAGWIEDQPAANSWGDLMPNAQSSESAR